MSNPHAGRQSKLHAVAAVEMTLLFRRGRARRSAR